MDQATQENLGKLVQRARSLNLKQFESLDGDVVYEGIIPALLGLLDSALDLLLVLEDKLREETAVAIRVPEAVEELSASCWLARAELRTSREQLGALKTMPDCWPCLIAAETAQGKIVRGLCAVEQRIAVFAGSRSTTQHMDLRQGTLSARRVIAKFRRAMMEAAERHGNDIATMVRSVGTGLARLQGRDEFRQLSVAHRVVAKRLHRRIIEWLQRDGSIQEGQRLWQEVESFAVILNEEGWGPETVEFDRQILREAIEEITDLPADQPLPYLTKAKLFLLFGRDEQLDRDLGCNAPVGSVLARLKELQRVVLSHGLALQDHPDELESAPEPS